jgi:DNA-binding transcriptional LysR family regulator
MNDIDWDDLRYFRAAADAGSLSGAAKHLHSHQPTVGRHIDALEAALGLKLFQRHKKGLTLTQEGLWVLEQSALMYRGVQAMQRRIEGDDQPLQGSVRLAVPEGLCNELLIPGLAAFYQRYPGLRLILNVSSRTANLTRGEADIALRLFRPKETDLVTRPLMDMAMGLYASRPYLDAHGTPVTLADLARHRLIGYGDELAGLPENQWLLAHVPKDAWVLQSDSTTSRLRATVCGLGLSLQPCLFVKANPELIPVLDHVSLPAHQVWITYHGDLRHILRIRVTVDFLIAFFVGREGS